MGHQESPLTELATSALDVRPTLVYRLSWPGNFTMEPVVPGTSTWPTSVEELTDVTGTCVDEGLFFVHSSELEDDEEVGVMGTELLPDDPFTLLKDFGFLFLV